jgi:hypothetical protein
VGVEVTAALAAFERGARDMPALVGECVRSIELLYKRRAFTRGAYELPVKSIRTFLLCGENASVSFYCSQRYLGSKFLVMHDTKVLMRTEMSQ